MMALLIILLVLFLICLLPVGIRAVYCASGPEVRAVAGPFSILVYPRPRKEKTAKQQKTQKPKEKELQQATAQNPKEAKKAPIGGKIQFFKELLGLGLEALGCVRRKLILKDLKLCLTVGAQGEDAAKGAITYGRAWAAVGALTPVLENTFRIKNRDIQVELDYLSDKNVIYAEGCLILLVGDILWMALYYGIRAFKIFLKQKQKGRNTHGTSHQ